jgi:hypothetical protein
MSNLKVAHLPTRLERADRLGAAFALRPGQLWIKRDDCTGLATGGNKARKLEVLLADAFASGCDVWSPPVARRAITLALPRRPRPARAWAYSRLPATPHIRQKRWSANAHNLSFAE